MALNDFMSDAQKKEYEKIEERHQRSKKVMDLMILLETDTRIKKMMLIAKQCFNIRELLYDISLKYADFENEKITEQEATEVLEYLQLVESGIVQFMKEKEESR